MPQSPSPRESMRTKLMFFGHNQGRKMTNTELARYLAEEAVQELQLSELIDFRDSIIRLLTQSRLDDMNRPLTPGK